MPMPAYTRTAIQQAIREHGPLSAAELAAVLELTRRSVDASLNAAREKFGTQYFRIAAYRRQATGKGGREIPVYGLGPEPDVPRPELGAAAHREVKQRYAEKYRDVINHRARMRRRGRAGNPFAGLL